MKMLIASASLHIKGGGGGAGGLLLNDEHDFIWVYLPLHIISNRIQDKKVYIYMHRSGIWLASF